MATTDLAFSYSNNSTLVQQSGMQQLVLAHQSELSEVSAIPCFFWGSITDPLLTSKCLLTLAKVVQSSFGPVPPSLRDPIVSAGTDQIRFEGFSSCNGVYARVDLLEDAIDGEFISSGTTNVDFNEPMLNALNAVKKTEKMVLGVGSKEVSISTDKTKVVEKKVTLPPRWIKGLTSVQLYLAGMEQKYCLTKIQIIQLFQGIPKGNVKGELYLSQRGPRFVFSPIATAGSVRIGGLQRLRLLEGILPYAEKLIVYQEDGGESCAFVADFGKIRLSLALSPDSYRGFSGEGNVLENMVKAVRQEWVHAVNSLLKSNALFDPTLLAIEHDVDFASMDTLTGSPSSIGLLGYDLHDHQHYYRRLPFKMERILALNPRLKNAQKLVTTDGVQFVKNTPSYIEARVEGSGVKHTVIIAGDKQQCTCDWFTNHQGKRGLCKHILAVKMLNG